MKWKIKNVIKWLMPESPLAKWFNKDFWKEKKRKIGTSDFYSFFSFLLFYYILRPSRSLYGHFFLSWSRPFSASLSIPLVCWRERRESDAVLTSSNEPRDLTHSDVTRRCPVPPGCKSRDLTSCHCQRPLKCFGDRGAKGGREKEENDDGW